MILTLYINQFYVHGILLLPPHYYAGSFIMIIIKNTINLFIYNSGFLVCGTRIREFVFRVGNTHPGKEK